MFESSTDPRYAELGKNRFVKLDSWRHYIKLMKRIISDNDLISIDVKLLPYYAQRASWYRSDESIT